MNEFLTLLLIVGALYQMFAANARIARAKELDGTPIKLETVPDGIYTFIGSFQNRMFLRDMHNRIIDVPAPGWFAKLPVWVNFTGGKYCEFEIA